MPLGAIESGILSNHISVKTDDCNNEIPCGFKALISTLECIRENSELYTAKAKKLESVVENNSEYIEAILSDENKNRLTLSLVSAATYNYAMIHSYDKSFYLFKKTEKDPMRQKLEYSLGKLHDNLNEHIKDNDMIHK